MTASPQPTTNEGKSSKQSLETRFFVVGCVLLGFSCLMVGWAFYRRILTPDERQMYLWVLPLVSGFAAGALVGSFTIESHGYIPGGAVTAAGGFAMWLVTINLLFSDTPVLDRSVTFRLNYKGEFQSDLQFDITVYGASQLQSLEKTKCEKGEILLRIPAQLHEVFVKVEATEFEYSSDKPLAIIDNMVQVPLRRRLRNTSASVQDLKTLLNERVYPLVGRMTNAFSGQRPEDVLKEVSLMLDQLGPLESKLATLRDIMTTTSTDGHLLALDGLALCYAIENHLLFRQSQLEPSQLPQLRNRMLSNAEAIHAHVAVFEGYAGNDEASNALKPWIGFSTCTAKSTDIVFGSNAEESRKAATEVLTAIESYSRIWKHYNPDELELFRRVKQHF